MATKYVTYVLPHWFKLGDTLIGCNGHIEATTACLTERNDHRADWLRKRYVSYALPREFPMDEAVLQSGGRAVIAKPVVLGGRSFTKAKKKAATKKKAIAAATTSCALASPVATTSGAPKSTYASISNTVELMASLSASSAAAAADTAVFNCGCELCCSCGCSCRRL